MDTRRILTGLTLAIALAAPARSQIITTVAGNSSWGRTTQPAMDAAGNLYAADYDKHVVYKIDRLGATTTFAGTGTAGYAGDGALATAARIWNPYGVAVGSDGSVYIAEYGGNRIRKVASNGIITTFAGTGAAGFTGDGGQASAARLNGPGHPVFDTAGNLFFVDVDNARIRKITPAGVITTVAGSGATAFTGDGGLATSTNMFPGWMTITADGTIYFTDDGDTRSNGNKRLRKIAPNGIVSTIAGTGVAGFSGDGGPATSAQLRSVSGVAVDPLGNIYVSEIAGHRIRKIGVNGIINTFAGTGTAGATGDGGPAVSALLNAPCGLMLDSEGNLYVADMNNKKIRKISPPPLPSISFTSAAIPAFGGKAKFGSNMYVEIYGSNLASTARTWAGSDFNGSNAPTSLDGVSVTINNKPAFIYFISPGQINVNTPEDTATGPVQIQVRTPIGISNVGTAERERVSPSLQTTPQFTAAGKQYVVAQTPDFRSFIGRANLIQGVAFRDAKPNDIVIIYALGCGPTSPAYPAGVVAGSNAPLTLPYEVKIGGVRANVTFAGLAANTVGLYQFNVVIPNVVAGDQPIELIVDGLPNAQNLFITIGQ